MMFRTIRPIIMILIAVGLFFSYIQPTFTDIRSIQDETNDYTETIAKAEEFNQLVRSLVDRKNSFTPNELARLEAYVPDTIDGVSVMSDIQTLVSGSGLLLESVSESEWIEPSDREITEGISDLIDPEDADLFELDEDIESNDRTESGTEYLVKHFSVSALGTYEQFKVFVADLERSLTPIEMMVTGFSTTESGLNSYVMDLRVRKLK